MCLRFIKSLFVVAAFALSIPLAAEVKVAAFAGSNRAGSFNKKLVQQAGDIARQQGASVTFLELNDDTIPIYSADLESTRGMPAEMKRIRQIMIASDAIIIASPEYNGSIPALLKNILDWASRSEEGKPSRDAFKGKKFAIMSTSPGGGGGARALVHLRDIIEDVGGEVVQLQVSVPDADKSFDSQGNLINPEAKNELTQEIQQLLNSNKQALQNTEN